MCHTETEPEQKQDENILFKNGIWYVRLWGWEEKSSKEKQRETLEHNVLMSKVHSSKQGCGICGVRIDKCVSVGLHPSNVREIEFRVRR